MIWIDQRGLVGGKDGDSNGPPLKGTDFGESNVINFWSIGPSAAQTEETPSGALGWLQGDDDGTWFAALEAAALTLIMGYVVLAKGVSKRAFVPWLVKRSHPESVDI